MKKLALPLFTIIILVLIISSCKKENQPPVIQSISAYPQIIRTGEETQLTCVANDPDGDNLIFLWSSLNGTFINGTNSNSVSWKAPDEAGIYIISVIVNDQKYTAIDTIHVEVEVKPQLSVTPTAIDFGIYDTKKNIKIKNIEKGILTWIISEDSEWITISTNSGQTTTETDAVMIEVNRDGLEPGNYSSTITITSNGGNQYVSVLMKVGNTGQFTDERDNNTYKWIKIAEQIWMAENLAYLPAVVPSSEESLSKPYYYMYDYQGISVYEAKATDNYKTYGVLYNWLAAMEACPTGWHLPTDNEWKQMEMYIGMSQSDADKEGWRYTDMGAKLKATSGWNDFVGASGNGTDNFGFSGLPGGNRSYSGLFEQIGRVGYWWNATENTNLYASYRGLYNQSTDITRFSTNKEMGFSIRCVKN